MMHGQISGISFTGQAAANALKIVPYVEAMGFDGQAFMMTNMQQLQGMGVIRDSAITAVEHKGEIASAVTHLIQNSGPLQGRG